MGICPQSHMLLMQEEVSPAAQDSYFGARAHFVSGNGHSQAQLPSMCALTLRWEDQYLITYDPASPQPYILWGLMQYPHSLKL